MPGATAAAATNLGSLRLRVCRIRLTHTQSAARCEKETRRGERERGLFYLSSGRLRFHRATRGWRLASWFLTLSRPTQLAFGFNYLAVRLEVKCCAQSVVCLSAQMQLCVFKVCAYIGCFVYRSQGTLCPTSARERGKQFEYIFMFGVWNSLLINLIGNKTTL